MNELAELAYKYGSDKCPEIRHSYTDFYHEMFADKRASIKKVLEIGVGSNELMSHSPHYTNGASLYMWRDYFPNSQIYGIDIAEGLVFGDDRIQTLYCDQADPVQLKKLIEKIGNDIDIVIDDGSHRNQHQIISCQTLMPLLKRDIIYVIEDVTGAGAAAVIGSLPDYDCRVIKRSRKLSFDDRLIVISNKNG